MTEPEPAIDENGSSTKTPAYKFGIAVLLGVLLAIPLFSVYLLVYDRQSQSVTARDSIVAGWGESQKLAGPYLAIPYTHAVTVSAIENGQQVTRNELREDALYVAPADLAIDTKLDPQLRRRSIYEAVLYLARVRARGSFVLPDLAKLKIDPAGLRLDQAELRLGISSAKGLGGSQPIVTVGGRDVALIPGSGLSQTGGSGFSGHIDLPPDVKRLSFEARFEVRGHDAIAILPAAQDTRWHVESRWPNPSFLGGFLPTAHRVDHQGFAADWRIGNLALNRPTVSVGEQPVAEEDAVSVALIDPVNLYDEVNRATKYGFLFIGFTFATLLMFDLIAGVQVPGPAYLLVGAGLVLFFVLLLALAEVVGFLAAYLLASAAIVGLISSYAAAILGSWRRGGLISGLLIGLYAVLYVLLSLEAYSLLIGSLLLFAALALVMYMTRRIDWRRAASPRGRA